METVLVTGGTGFIGLHCIQQLLDKGYKVRTTIRSASRKQEVLDAYHAALMRLERKLYPDEITTAPVWSLSLIHI